jgi:hypothetical protein
MNSSISGFAGLGRLCAVVLTVKASSITKSKENFFIKIEFNINDN